MKKNLLTCVLCAFAFGLGFGLNNIAFSDAIPAKVAYVNVAKLLESSKTIKAANDQKAKQTQDMLKWFNTASEDIKKQKTKEGKDALVKKYEAQLNQKKKAIADNYAKKITDVDKQLNDAITKKSQELGYSIVFRRDAVLVGGDDITSQILPLVK